MFIRDRARLRREQPLILNTTVYTTEQKLANMFAVENRIVQDINVTAYK